MRVLDRFRQVSYMLIQVCMDLYGLHWFVLVPKVPIWVTSGDDCMHAFDIHFLLLSSGFTGLSEFYIDV